MGDTAAVFLPAPLFQSITNRTNVGIFFNVYDTGVLFPITKETNASTTTVVGSPVLAATVGFGQNFNGLAEPVTILLELNQLEVSDINGGGFVPHFFMELLDESTYNLVMFICNCFPSYTIVHFFHTEFHKSTATMCLLEF